ncbi:MAG: T9SS type A sorting domain-containing protein [Lacibacter sp.]
MKRKVTHLGFQFKGLMIVMFALCTLSSYAQIYRGFTKIYSDNLRGGHTIIGNTLMAQYTSSSHITVNSTAMNQFRNATRTSDYVNDNSDMYFVDVDPGSNSLYNSSSADLILPTGSNTIKMARLYWGARVANSAIVNIPEANSNIRSIKIRKGTAGGYLALTAPASQLDKTVMSNYSSHSVYQAYADVTDFVQANGAGTYTVADITAFEGSVANGGGYAGWALVVVYENPSLPYSSVRVYDGYMQVFNGGSPQTQSITLTGLDAPSGGMTFGSAYMTAMTWEGDSYLTADYFKINGTQYSNLLSSGAVLNPATNFWNGTITKMDSVTQRGYHVTAKNPNYVNQMGIDIDEFYVGGTYGIIENAKQVNIEFGTESDQYFPSLFAFTMRMKDPQIQLDKYMSDAGGDLKVQQYEILTCVIEGQNLISAPGHSYNTVVTDTLPGTVDYVPNSMYIWDGSNWIAVSDAAGDDIAVKGYHSATASHFVKFHVGTGANAVNGGELSEGATFKFKFQIQAKANVSVVNTARMVGWNQALTQSFFDDASAALPGDQAPLAVKLLYFNGKLNGNLVQLEWKVASEQNTDYYEVERSIDGRNFKLVGSVQKNQAGNSETVYRFNDPVIEPSASFFYRIREIEVTGKGTESGILKLSSNPEINRYNLIGQNPANGFVTVQATLKNNIPLMIRVLSSNGAVMHTQTLNGQKGTNLYRLDAFQGLRNGLYIIEISDGTLREVFKIMKQ